MTLAAVSTAPIAAARKLAEEEWDDDTAEVLADWLEEQGMLHAAVGLRRCVRAKTPPNVREARKILEAVGTLAGENWSTRRVRAWAVTATPLTDRARRVADYMKDLQPASPPPFDPFGMYFVAPAVPNGPMEVGADGDTLTLARAARPRHVWRLEQEGSPAQPEHLYRCLYCGVRCYSTSYEALLESVAARRVPVGSECRRRS